MALFVASAFAGNAGAYTDVTGTYLNNADFSQGTPATVGICTYAKDTESNGTTFSSLLPVDGWTPISTDDARAGGLVAFGSGVWLGGPGYVAPSANSDGDAVGNILGLVAVWTGVAQYTQEVTFPSGEYTLVVPVYNSVGGTTVFSKNLIGFIESSGTEHLATATTYSVGTWTYEFVTFTLEQETTGNISLGYAAANAGSGAMPHLFVSAISLFEGEVDAEAYETEKEKARNAKELAANKEKLAGSCYATPSADLLINGSFDTANQGWTLNEMGYQANQERPTRYLEKWYGGGITGSGSAEQTLKNLPAGAYRFKGFANTRNVEENVAIYINDLQIEVTKSGWNEYEALYNHEDDGDITVNFSYTINGGSDWVAIDGFSLVYGGEYNAYEAAMHKGDWDAAISEAQAALSDYKNVTGSEKAALEAEIDKAEPTTAVGYDEARDALKSAINTFIAAVPSYDAFVGNCNAAAEYELAYASAASKEALGAACDAQPENAADAAAKAGEIITALRQCIESHAMAESVEGAKDMTSYIVNASDPVDNSGWTIEGRMNNPASNESWTDGSGNNVHSYFDGGDWGASAWTTTMKQDITIPAGKYLLTAIGRAAANVTLTMSVGDVEVELPSEGNAGNIFDRGWNDASLEFTTPGESAMETVTITVTATTETVHEWFSISRFRLVQLEEAEIMNASDEEYAALAWAITGAEACTLGFGPGEYAPYNNVQALNLLAAARAIDRGSDNSSKAVVAATEALNAAIWTANETDVDAIYNGDFAIVTEGQNYPDGWQRLNAWGQMQVDVEGTNNGTAYYNQPGSLEYGTTGVYTMPLAEETYYKLSFKYRSHENNSNRGVTVSVLNGESGLADYVFAENPSTTDWANAEIGFQTGAAGNYILTLGNGGNTWMTDVSLVKAEPETVELQVSEAGWATMILPFAADIPEGLTVYTCEAIVEGTYTLALTQQETIAANTPYVVNGQGDYEFTGVNIAAADTYTYGLLTGTYTSGLAPVGSYVLQTNNGVQAFYRVAENKQPTMGAYRCYLTVPTNEAPMFSFGRGEGTTSIDNAQLTNDNVIIYDLAGRRVEKMGKGIYIVNGHKVVK